MRKKIIAGNWKMNKNTKETTLFFKKFIQLLDDKAKERSDLVFFVPFTSIQAAQNSVKDSGIMIGAQNFYFEDSGAFTGEVSPLMLKDLGVKFVLVGHSERREIFKETNDVIAKKLKKAILCGLEPILCVGEKLIERKQGNTNEIIRMQIRAALYDIKEHDMKSVIIAYEPVWAIGTGNNATPHDAQQVHEYIRSLIREMYNNDIAENARIIYGGSMKPENSRQLMLEKDIDGGLIGGASLDPESFRKILDY